MYRIIAGATGLIGAQLVKRWLAQGHAITVIGRDQEKIHRVLGDRVRAMTWDRLTPELFRDAQVVVNLAGAGIAEQRWSPARKQEILNSRINTTQQLVLLITELGDKFPILFNASAVGIYGLQPQTTSGLPPSLDENTPIDWDKTPDFLSSVAREWEKATHVAKERGVRVVNLRFGVVLAKEGGALPKIAMPFNFFVGGKIGTGQQPFSWVAVDDVLRAIDFLLAKSQVSGPVNIVAPQCVTQYELAKAIAKNTHQPYLLPMPAFILKLMFGEMAQELLLEGQHVYPKHLLDAGFQFAFPELEPALQEFL